MKEHTAMRNVTLCISAYFILTCFGLRASEYPLHNAAYLGNVELVKELIRLGKNVNERNKDGMTPLHLAFRGLHHIPRGSDEGHKQVILELLQAPNIQVNVQDQSFYTPLHQAVTYTKSDMTAIIRILIHKRANPNIQDYDEKKLHYIKQ